MYANAFLVYGRRRSRRKRNSRSRRSRPISRSRPCSTKTPTHGQPKPTSYAQQAARRKIPGHRCRITLSSSNTVTVSSMTSSAYAFDIPPFIPENRPACPGRCSSASRLSSSTPSLLHDATPAAPGSDSVRSTAPPAPMPPAPPRLADAHQGRPKPTTLSRHALAGRLRHVHPLGHRLRLPRLVHGLEGFVILRSNQARASRAHRPSSGRRSSPAITRKPGTSARRTNASSANVLGNGLERIGRNKDSVEFIVEETALREANDLKTNTTYLSVIGVVSPMIGLTGTVWGMIGAFKTLGDKGISNPGRARRPHRREVLVATMSGLRRCRALRSSSSTSCARGPRAPSCTPSRRSIACSTTSPTSKLSGVRIGTDFGAAQLFQVARSMPVQRCLAESLPQRHHELSLLQRADQLSARPPAPIAARCSTGAVRKASRVFPSTKFPPWPPTSVKRTAQAPAY